MATSAFKSTTKRSSIGNSSAETFSSPSTSSTRNSANRRSRSLSRFSHRLPDDFSSEQTATRGKFVNSMRGSGNPDTSIDDIAANLFGSASRERGRLLISEDLNRDISSHRRGRSISRRESIGNTNNCAGGRVKLNPNHTRRRSVSVIRYQISDSESDTDRKRSSSTVPKTRAAVESNRFSGSAKTLRKSLSQIDLNDYSSQSSVVTDEETGEPYHKRSSLANAAKSKKTSDARKNNDMVLSEVMRKEIKNAVHEYKMELEQKRSNTRTPIKNSASANPERGRLPRTEQRVGKTHDRRRMTDRLKEEAEKYIEDFLSNIEDTDISSIDGERSETSSYFAFPTINEVDGVSLPWLQWETASDVAPTCRPRSMKDDESVSSHGSWNPKHNCEELRKYPTKSRVSEVRSSSFDLEECLRKPMEEDFLSEKLRQNGNTLLCAHISFHF